MAIAAARSTVDGRRERRESGRATPTARFARRDVATTLKTTASPTGSALLTADSDEGQSGVTSAPVATTSASVSSSSSSTRHALRNGTIAVIIIVVAFVLALAVASRVYFNWRRRAARKHNSTKSTFIQYVRYKDASPRRVSVVPRDDDDDDVLPPPIKPPEWDARSAAASSTAATFDSPISASERHFGPGAQVQVQSLDEKLRDIFYPAPAGPNPNPVRGSASFVPSFSSPTASTATTVTATPISPPPRAAHTQLPSFVPEPVTSPQAWTNPPPSPLPRYPSQTSEALSTFLSPWSAVGDRRVSVSPRTPVYGNGVLPEIRINGRPPSYSRH